MTGQTEQQQQRLRQADSKFWPNQNILILIHVNQSTQCFLCVSRFYSSSIWSQSDALHKLKGIVHIFKTWASVCDGSAWIRGLKSCFFITFLPIQGNLFVLFQKSFSHHYSKMAVSFFLSVSSFLLFFFFFCLFFVRINLDLVLVHLLSDSSLYNEDATAAV